MKTILFVLKTVMGGRRRRECWVLRVIHRPREWPPTKKRITRVGAGADRDVFGGGAVRNSIGLGSGLLQKSAYYYKKIAHLQVQERASPGCPLLLRNSPWPTAMCLVGC